MSTYINKIVQKTRQLSGVDADLAMATGEARTDLEQHRRALMDARQAMVLEAVRAGVDVDLMRWAISINDEPAKVQMQFAMAHAAAAIVLDTQ